MIIWNWNKVNSYISALKPLPRVPNRSKWPWCWDILIFETSGTSTSFGKCQWFYKCTIYIDEIWVESTTRYLWKHGYTLQQPPKHPKTIKTTPRHPRHTPCSPGTALTTPKHSWNILRGIQVVKGCQRKLWEEEIGQKVPVECLKCLWLSNAALGKFYGISRVLYESLGISGAVLRVLDGVGRLRRVSGTIFPSISLNFRKS